MQIIYKTQARPAMDGDGVNIKRIADFGKQSFDPYLMLDELKSDDKQDFIGGFPPHPHRGIETFTYIMKGGFEHRDHMGNVKAIRAGDVQWMSTGSGVIHSEMPLADVNEGLHGFQIWLNMPAKDKMRPAIYRDTTLNANPSLLNGKGAKLIALAGTWQFADTPDSITNTHIEGLAGSGAIADLSIEPNSSANIALNQYGAVNAYIYHGQLNVLVDGENVVFGEGTMLKLNPQILAQFNAGDLGLGCLILAGNPINEQIVHMGPFVMNTQAEINQAVEDYQQGRFGHLAH